MIAVLYLSRSDNLDAAHYVVDDLLKQSVISVMKEVTEANIIADEFNKDCHFDIVLVSALARGLDEGRTEVCDGYPSIGLNSYRNIIWLSYDNETS